MNKCRVHMFTRSKIRSLARSRFDWFTSRFCPRSWISTPLHELLNLIENPHEAQHTSVSSSSRLYTLLRHRMNSTISFAYLSALLTPSITSRFHGLRIPFISALPKYKTLHDVLRISACKQDCMAHKAQPAPVPHTGFHRPPTCPNLGQAVSAFPSDLRHVTDNRKALISAILMTLYLNSSRRHCVEAPRPE